jgi:L-seryl-tRNA(Ser) seleniumtransferase
VIVDAADAVPPVSNFWRYTRDHGADAVVISGGKGLRGPQNTGLVLGSRAIVEGCTFLGSPNDRFGRSMKVSKEAMAGVYAAVKHLVAGEAELAEAASRRAETLARELSSLDGLSVQRSGDEVVIRLPQERLMDGDIHARLLEGDQAVLAFCRGNTVRINAAIIQPGQEGTIAQRLRLLLGR